MEELDGMIENFHFEDLGNNLNGGDSS